VAGGEVSSCRGSCDKGEGLVYMGWCEWQVSQNNCTNANSALMYATSVAMWHKVMLSSVLTCDRL